MRLSVNTISILFIGFLFFLQGCTMNANVTTAPAPSSGTMPRGLLYANLSNYAGFQTAPVVPVIASKETVNSILNARQNQDWNSLVGYLLENSADLKSNHSIILGLQNSDSMYGKPEFRKLG